MKQNLLPILVFFLLAFVLSWLANEFIPPLTVRYPDVKTILTGLAPAVSGLLCYVIFKTPNTNRTSPGGTRPLFSYGSAFLVLLLPLLMSRKATYPVLVGSI